MLSINNVDTTELPAAFAVGGITNVSPCEVE